MFRCSCCLHITSHSSLASAGLFCRTGRDGLVPHAISGVWEMYSSSWGRHAWANWPGRWFRNLPLGWGVCFGRGRQELRTSQKSAGFLPPWHPLQPPLRTEADWLSSSFPFGPTSLMYPEASCLTSEDSIIVLICIRLGIFKLLFFLMFHKLSLTPGYDIGRLVLFPLYK